jgi:hypothetical protein
MVIVFAFCDNIVVYHVFIMRHVPISVAGCGWHSAADVVFDNEIKFIWTSCHKENVYRCVSSNTSLKCLSQSEPTGTRPG